MTHISTPFSEKLGLRLPLIVAPMAGMALAKVKARYLMGAGLALTGLGLLLMSGLEANSEWTALLLGFLLAGIGVGLLNPVIADVALSVVPKEQSGMAAGINDTFRQVGIAVGIAAWGADGAAAALMFFAIVLNVILTLIALRLVRQPSTEIVRAASQAD